jgi:hypothetical protein
MMAGENVQTVPMASVLRQLASELTHADQQIGLLEPVLQTAMKSHALGPKDLSTLQSLDHLRQTLVALGLFLGNLADAPESRVTINAHTAARPLGLQALAERLAHPEAAPAAARLASGNLHLF